MEEPVKQILQNILNWCIDNITFITIVLLSVIEISPIKVNPVKAFCTWFGKILLNDVIDSIKKIEKRQAEQKEELEQLKSDVDKRFNKIEHVRNMDTMDSIRWDILQFANSCRHGKQHTLDEFKHIIRQNNKYEKLVEIEGVENGVYELEYKYILKVYKQCQDNDSFLK